MMKIIDTHSHLWLRQDTVVNGMPIRTLENGRSLFMGEVRQMVPPFIIDGRNTAEIFLSNMDYAQVTAAVVVQEFIDGLQNDYLADVQKRYPDRFIVCGMAAAGKRADKSGIPRDSQSRPQAADSRRTHNPDLPRYDGDVPHHGTERHIPFHNP